jgi:hypothetical protein
MKRNIGGIERTVRVLIGVLLLIFPFVGLRVPGTIAVGSGVVGIFLMITAFFAY